jgi:predicted O-linked N-acetylglucosamine transferase (SPINDLY family)
LPATGFVFCCFNASYKIDPATFASWMRILARVHGSVLLLYAQSGQVEGNLRREAAARGIDAGRIVFAERVPFADYLARYQAMDLFLDTQPYNAGATASDALWAGLPVLTRLGTSFAGRIGASLLEALGLPELIVSTAQQYEDAAVDLAADPHRLAALRRRLMANRLTAALFDTRGFARSLEAAYVEIHRRYQADLPPVDVQVSRETAAARTLPGPAAT